MNLTIDSTAAVPVAPVAPVAPAPDFHFQGKWYGCDRSQPALRDAQDLVALCIRAVSDAGLAIVSTSKRQFFPSGASAAVHLAESHLVVRTWPDEQYLSLEMLVGHEAADHTAKAWAVLRTLTRAFRPNEAVDVDLMERAAV